MFVKKKVSPILCINFGHLSVLIVSLLFQSVALSETSYENHNESLLFYKNLKNKTKLRGRGPANFVPDDQIEPLPIENKSWTQKILVDDDAGVLDGVRRDLQQWQETEEYAKAWNLESTGVYDVPTTDTKKDYLQRMILKYADKRLSGEVRKAEEGSTLHSVGQAQKALKPNAEASVTKNIKIKFKARVLQGKAMMTVINPYVEYETSANLSGEVNLDAKKEFKELGIHAEANYRADEDKLKVHVLKTFKDMDIQAQIDYQVSDANWTASLQKPIYKSLVGRVSSTQSDKEMIMRGGSEQVMEVLYSSSF